MTAAVAAIGRARDQLATEWRRVQASPLLGRGGVDRDRGLIDRRLLGRLLDEARSATPRLDVVTDADHQDTEQVRGGCPRRRLRSIAGGPVQSALFADPALAAFVSGEVGAPARPCGSQASFTWYRGDGSHLGIHRDIVGCDVALITCVDDDAPDADGGALDVWLDDGLTPLDILRADPDRGRTRIPLAAGDSMLIHGGVLPHRVPALHGRRSRIVSLMCFEIVGGSGDGRQ